MRLGAPVFVDTEDPEEIARAHRALGYRAAFCPHVEMGESARIRAIREAFAKHDVVIGEVGVWRNLIDPEETARKANLEAMREGLALADEVGARCVVNIAGSHNPRNWAGPHPKDVSQEAFDLFVENARSIIDAVRPKRAKFTYEMMPWMLPDSAESYLDLMQAVDRPAFAVHLDAVNIINSPRRYFDTTSVIRECFAKLGPHIVCCHLKDIKLQDGLTVHLEEVMVGQGGFDIRSYLREVQKLPHQPPVLLEHLQTAEQFAQARRYVMELAREIGVDFER
jgi:sugar phosphate isomerase/epimerase